MNYDFSQLNDKEFEELTVDLLAVLYSTRIERFKGGRDGGIDGRYYYNSTEKAIIQCKHYLKTGYKGMISKLRKEEVNKVRKLSPDKYIFVTSKELSALNKDEIVSLFSPFISCANDVFGMQDVNDLIKKNPEIENRYFKLWISSAEVLNRFINNSVIGRSKFELERIVRDSKKYVQTESYDIAIEKLKSKKILIISGEPGIGKTTLAENVCLFYASNDYELIDVQDSIKDAEDVYVEGRKQIFYFDDFLGSNYFEAIENRSDSNIVKFMVRIKHDNTKLFVLTSRTTILNSGVCHSSVFSNVNIRKDEFLLDVKLIGTMDKARILYNHIWFSELSDDYIDEIYKGKRYRDIIEHKNFNPRLIEFITDVTRLDEVDCSKYWVYIENKLNNPKEIWSDCFRNQNNSFVRGMVNLVVFNGGVISEKDLRNSFLRLVKYESMESLSHIENDFDLILRLAVKSFLRREMRGEVVSYKLFNPSISDFVIGEYSNNISKLSGVYSSLLTIDSVYHLESMWREKIISDSCYFEIRNLTYSCSLFDGVDANFMINNFGHMLFKAGGDKKREEMFPFIVEFINNPVYINEFECFIDICDELFSGVQINDWSFISKLISNRFLTFSEVKILVDFIEKFHIEDDGVNYSLKESIEDYIYDEINDRKSDIDLSKYIKGEFEDIYVDEISVKSELEDIEISIISEIEWELSEGLIEGLDLDSVHISIDIDEMLQEYIYSESPTTRSRSRPYQGGGYDKIDDLFDRS